MKDHSKMISMKGKENSKLMGNMNTQGNFRMEFLRDKGGYSLIMEKYMLVNSRMVRKMDREFLKFLFWMKLHLK